MLSDLNFLSTIKSLGTVLGVNPSTMKQNPFMMPAPIPERNFQGLREKSWRSLRLFSSKEDPVQRVADAESYLVWCLSNLQDLPAPSPVRNGNGGHSPTSSLPHHKQSWQQRAEKQLEVLSMPLESLSGPTYVQDSSKMMKRKGVLPSLPQSPPKTLRELMGNTRQSEGEEEDYGRGDNNRSVILRTHWSGEDFSANPADFEALGALEAPPHHMVTLVAASVLILLSPADQLPKDLSWPSCQKMLRRGRSLIQRVQGFEVAGVPAFKWKALVPFLQNDHFQPKFLAQFSCAASSMCAWVFSVLRAAQQQDYERLGLHTSDGLDAVGEEDRLELLSELEVDSASSPSSKSSSTVWESREENESQLPPLSRSKSGKRVSIGSAEVLFINENRPVKMTTPPPVLVHCHDGERSQQVAEMESTEETDERRLMIKIYEPMSSVESQMSVDTEDLRQDFGEDALVAFQTGQYRTLCDVMLRQLDKMMGADIEGVQSSEPEVDEEFGALEASVLKIQCAARQQLARGKTNRVRAQKEQVEESALRIQCAARQKQARRKVDRVRAEKKIFETVPEGDELQVDSEEPAHAAEVEEQSEDVAVPESRPGTVMSYASDQFEEEFET
ncbi:cysteine desulfurase [Phytophthora nicotianae]|uniref:Cysteine desulfurase n=1 Tax=Phytophthora nicotianae TaxID=4792 RepID=A0A0W8CTS4_PHYNI|nr:cysteine desulfurase [Phytophthora nicotianae]